VGRRESMPWTFQPILPLQKTRNQLEVLPVAQPHQ
jgi:hypothetical protein